jgi:hypothetical protein
MLPYRVIRKHSSSIYSRKFRFSCEMSGMLVLIIDFQLEWLASHVTMTGTAHYVVMEITLPGFHFSLISCSTACKLSS